MAFAGHYERTNPAPGLSRQGRVQRLDTADRRRLCFRRPRFRRRKERLDQGLREPLGDDTDCLRRPSGEGLQLLGPGATRPGSPPELSRGALRVCPLLLRRGHRRTVSQVGPGRRDLRSLPLAPGRDHRRLHDQRAALPPDRQWKRMGRDGASPHPRLVPAVSEPLHRECHLRQRREALRERRRRRKLQLGRLRPGRQPVEPRRRSSGRRWGNPDSADG